MELGSHTSLPFDSYLEQTLSPTRTFLSHPGCAQGCGCSPAKARARRADAPQEQEARGPRPLLRHLIGARSSAYSPITVYYIYERGFAVLPNTCHDQVYDRSMSPAQRRREPDGKMHHRSRRLAALAPSNSSSALLDSLRLGILSSARPVERQVFIDKLLVRIHLIIETGLAPWEFEFPF